MAGARGRPYLPAVLAGVILATTTALLVAVLAGILVRGRFRRAGLWAPYLAAVLAFQIAFATWPELGQSWSAYARWQAVLAVIELLVVVDISVRAFGGLPGARRAAAFWMLVVLVSTACAAVMVAPAPGAELDPQTSLPDPWRYLGKVVVPWLKAATTFSAATASSIGLYYRVPFDHLHKAALLGLTAYLMLSVVAIEQFRAARWLAHPWSSYVDTGAFTLLLVYWTREAWRRDDVFEGATPELRTLWPWI